MLNTRDILLQAIRKHQTGDSVGADAFCRMVLGADPNQPDALHLLGIMAHQSNRPDEAIELINHAIESRPDSAEYYSNLALILNDCRRYEEAIAACRKALILSPDHAVAHNNLGNALCGLRQFDEAVIAYERAIKLKPDYAAASNNLGNAFKGLGLLDLAIDAYRAAIAMQPGHLYATCNLGSTLMQQGKLDEAAAAYRQALAIDAGCVTASQQLGAVMLMIFDQREDPAALDQCILHLQQAIAGNLSPARLAEAYANLGKALLAKSRIDESIAACRRAIQLDPNLAQAHNNLGTALAAAGDLAPAIAAYESALRLQPDLAEIHNNLGVALRRSNLGDRAIAACTTAIKLRPDYADGHNNFGSALYSRGEIDRAIPAYRKAIELNPDHASAHCNLGLALLVSGNFEEGWREFEWRWRVKELCLPPIRTSQPAWDGSDLNGRRILLHAEQGMGDSIQFVRYLPMVKQRGGRITLACPKELIPLFNQLTDADQITAVDQPLPEFDVHCPLVSLPRVLGTRLETIPAEIPYLKADPPRSARWRERLPRDARRKVGLAWSGQPVHPNDLNRSMPLSALAPLAKLSGVQFFSLQKGKAKEQTSKWPTELTDWTNELTDFAETAALVENLDLVITVDTAVAHLAGAMGKPVWLLLPFAPDWRWMLRREDSPWYPTARLFRQTTAGDWTEPVGRVIEALGTT
jgi:tetratricopeptide (TPR) repeat protein